MIRVYLKGLEIFTRQPLGYYWLTAGFAIPDRDNMKLRTERVPYLYSMDLGIMHSFEDDLPDWSLWENSDLVKGATLTTYLHINDRTCQLTKRQKPVVVELVKQ